MDKESHRNIFRDLDVLNGRDNPDAHYHSHVHKHSHDFTAPIDHAGTQRVYEAHDRTDDPRGHSHSHSHFHIHKGGRNGHWHEGLHVEDEHVVLG